MKDEKNKKQNWFVEISTSKKLVHVENEFTPRSRPNPDWELVETYFGTGVQAVERANKHLENALKARNK